MMRKSSECARKGSKVKAGKLKMMFLIKMHSSVLLWVSVSDWNR